MNKTMWIAFYTLLHKEIIRIVRIWQQTLIPPIVTAALYFIIFGGFVGHYVGQVHGVPYIYFLVPGLVIMSAMNNAYSNVSSSYFGAKFQNNIDELIIAPIPYQMIMWGYIAGGVFRGFLIGILVLIVSVLFTHIHIVHPILALIVLLLSMVVFALGGFINGVYAKKFDDVTIIPNFVLTPLIYLGGVFYSIQSLSPAWQWVAKLNPIFYLVDAFRYAMIGQADVNIGIAFGFVIGFFVVFYLLALYLLKTSNGLRD